MLSCGSMGFIVGRSPVWAGDDGDGGDDVEWLAGEVFCDGFYVGVNDGLFTSSALEEFQVLIIVHEEVFCEDCGAEGFSEDVEA